MLHGPPAVGKLTVAKALAARTGLKLFHNHLTLDAITAVFAFGSPTFLRLRESIWLDVFESAAREGISLIFTVWPEKSLAPRFAERVREAVERHGGRLRLVELTCEIDVQEARLDLPSRAEHAKLRSVEQMRGARAGGWLDYPMPASELTIDTGATAPAFAAEQIAAALGLPVR